MKPSGLGRLLFGGVLAFNGINQLNNAEGMIGYAESKGIPAADLAVPFSAGVLVFGGLGIVLWRLPRLAAGALATFLAVTTPTMHDFWNAEEEAKQDEMFHFLKNVAMLGGALSLLSVAEDDAE
jgi:uncharacterized membrane protein YphA (DoxX/SURF4 family)